MRLYNINLKGMVDNYRRIADKHSLNTSKYSDEQLFNLIDGWCGAPTGEEQQEAVMDEIRENQ